MSQNVSKNHKNDKLNDAQKHEVIENKDTHTGPVIVVKNLTKTFGGFTAVNNISFNVNKGTIHGFIGPNGAGKTTTIKCLISAMVIRRGQILINGHPSTSLEAKKSIGYIPENTNFPKGISTYRFLISMCQLNGISKEASIKIITDKLKQFDLWKFKNKSPNSYSSGMKKKVLLIQALSNNPNVIIMDEPAANLDPSARTDLFNQLKDLKNAGKTVFISSHILTELQEIADEITILNLGKVAYSGLLQNQTTSKYEIKSSDNVELYKLLKDNDFVVKKEKEFVAVEADSDAELNKISQLALKNKITIYSFQLQSTNLQKLYEEMVMEAPKEHQ